MVFKLIFLFFIFGSVADAQCAAIPVITDPISAHLSPVQNLKGYAVTVCFGDGFPADKVMENETYRAAHFYIQNGVYPIEAYNETYDLAHAFLKKTI
jgi:hypothetical protein